MAKSALRLLGTLCKYELFGLAMFSLGGIYVAVLITVPRLAYMAIGLL